MTGGSLPYPTGSARRGGPPGAGCSGGRRDACSSGTCSGCRRGGGCLWGTARTAPRAAHGRTWYRSSASSSVLYLLVAVQPRVDVQRHVYPASVLPDELVVGHVGGHPVEDLAQR